MEKEEKYQHLPVNAMLTTLILIMKNNNYCFSDIHWIQLRGTDMGAPPAPTYVTVFTVSLNSPLLNDLKITYLCTDNS